MQDKYATTTLRIAEHRQENMAKPEGLKQGRPTRGPPKVLKWPTKSFCVGWLIDASALTL